MSRYCNKLAKKKIISSKKWSETTIVCPNFYDYALFLE
jgi:hypothetical protein